MDPFDLIGKYVVYTKSGNRHGWTGLVTAVTSDCKLPGGYSVEVEYDVGVNQIYCIQAIEGFQRESSLYPNTSGYIKIMQHATTAASSKPSEPRILVFCNQTREIVLETDNESFALTEANRMADSSTGYSYSVFYAGCKFQRSEPPVIRTDFD